MPDAEFQDAITYQPQALKVVREANALQLLEDENLRLVLRLLRKQNQPMTVKELETSFGEEAEVKSDKTIYRYINKLEKAELVVQAGKRMFTDEKKKIRTQTLYARTAKIFLPDYGEDTKKHYSSEEDKLKEQIVKMVGVLIGNKYGLDRSKISEDCLNALLHELGQQKSKLTIELLESSLEELDELTADLELE
ncbi:MAG: hypothetical protein ACXAB4_13580, partial [Candidatus Hodarchaeales archaeon]